jgi:predicted MFS family arabinose efflux permease
MIAAGMAFLGFLAAILLGRSVDPTTTRRVSPPPLNVLSLIDRGVLISSILSVCLIATSPAMTAFLPVYARAVGVDNLGVAFIASGVATIGTPLAMGRLMSRLPRGWWIALGFVVMGLGLGLMLGADDLARITVASVVYGAGSALAYPALLALAIDRADPQRPGTAMATFSMAYQVGTAFGAPLSGALIEWFGFGAMFLGAIGSIVVGLGILAARWQSINRSAASTLPV